jgi:adenylyltransferase/sulfurtransferase
MDWSLQDRQKRLSNWNQEKISNASVLVVGAGGLGGNAGRILIPIGVGRLDWVDHDIVEDSNRNRQPFMAEDVGKPKAHQLLKNLSSYATFPTLMVGHHQTFQAFAENDHLDYDVILCGVDNDEANVAVARAAVRTGLPVVFVNVSRDGGAFRIFVQRPGEACFACYRPDACEPKPPAPCIPSPAIADVLQAAVGFATRAVVAEIFETPINMDWNCRDVTFYGFDVLQKINKKHDCSVCGGL